MNFSRSSFFFDPDSDPAGIRSERVPLLHTVIGACLETHRRLASARPEADSTSRLESLIETLRECGLAAEQDRVSSSTPRTEAFDLRVESEIGLKLGAADYRVLGPLEEGLLRNGLHVGVVVDFDQPDPTDALWLVRASTQIALAN